MPEDQESENKSPQQLANGRVTVNEREASPSEPRHRDTSRGITQRSMQIDRGGFDFNYREGGRWADVVVLAGDVSRANEAPWLE